MLQINPSEQDGELFLSLSGELDHHAARDAMDRAEDLLVLYPCQRVALELSGLQFMDSSGLAVVMHLHRTCARAGYDFRVCGTPEQPMRVFEAAGLPHIIIFERGKRNANCR